MYQVALCDDERDELEKTQRMLETYEKQMGCEFMIKWFESAENLLYAVRENHYLPDLVLMDIYMPGKTGVDAARELQNMEIGSRIVFLTTSKEHALEAFRVEAAQYLVKPVTPEELSAVMDRILEDLAEEREKYILLYSDGRLRRVALKDIVWCEAQGKTQSLALMDGGLLKLHMTMKELSPIFSAHSEFVRVGIAYIINLKYVESLSAKDVCMNTGKRIYLPRGAYQPLKKQYLRYYCGEE